MSTSVKILPQQRVTRPSEPAKALAIGSPSDLRPAGAGTAVDERPPGDCRRAHPNVGPPDGLRDLDDAPPTGPFPAGGDTGRISWPQSSHARVAPIANMLCVRETASYRGLSARRPDSRGTR